MMRLGTLLARIEFDYERTGSTARAAHESGEDRILYFAIRAWDGDIE